MSNNSVNPQLIQLIAQQYNLDVKKILPKQKGYRNTIIPLQLVDEIQLIKALHYPLKKISQVCLILFKNETQCLIRRNNAFLLTNFLAKKGWPVRVMLSPSNSDKQSQITKKILALKNKKSKNLPTRHLALYSFLPGKTISWEAYTQKHLKILGKTLGDLHYDLAEIPLKKQQLPQAVTELEAQLAKMQAYFQQNNVQQALAKKLQLKTSAKIWQSLAQLLIKLAQIKQQQPLHLDFVRSNILWTQTDQNWPQISGILDFEKTALGPTILDIARTLAFLIVDCKYKPENKVRKYFLYSGYRKRSASQLQNLELLNPLLNFFWLYDFYKFLKHNPYEYLPKNEHFQRTVEQLKKQQLITAL